MANNQLLASDSFTSGSLAAAWTTPASSGGFQFLPAVAGSPFVAEPPNTTNSGNAIWTGLSWPNDQTSEITISVIPGTSGNVSLYLRWQSGSINGYLVSIAHNILAVNKYVSGTPTQIGSNVGITPVAGDVWMAQIAGSCISVYQNGKQLGFYYDATYASGTPGFGVFDPTSTANSHVGSWRGYNAVQQDGIWTKQGIIIPANATDLAGTAPALGPQNPIVLFDTNPQIIGGTTCYKMWFGTSAGTGLAVGYAESPDGKTWTRKSSNVITGVGVSPSVVKVSGTYYLFDQASFGANVQLYTSTDGITWTNQSANVFAAASGLCYFAVVQTGATWTALYTLAPGTFPSSLNMATSTNSGSTWTASGSNPVASNFWGVVRPVQIAGTWYGWGQTANSHAQQATKPGIDPGEGLRQASTNFTSWSSPVHSIHHSQLFEGLNEPDGGAFTSFVMDVNGQALMYYSAGPDDGIQTGHSTLQIALATAPAASARVILFPENAVTQTATDNFTRGSLGGNWTIPTGATALQIASDLLEPSALSTHCYAAYTAGGSSSAPQYAEVTLATLTGTTAQISPGVYMQTGAASGYIGVFTGVTGTLNASAAQIYKVVSGTFTALGPSVAATPAATDVIRLIVTVGSDGSNVLSLYQNEYLLVQAQDYAATFTSGYPGAHAYNATAIADSQMSLWASGNASVLPKFANGAGLLLGVG